MQELGVQDTLGILSQPWVRPARTSAGLGWQGLYLSTQAERPYRNAFDGARSHLLILHLDGPVTVRRGRRGLTDTRRVPPGGLFLHPADTALDVELSDRLHTVHVYLSEESLQQALGESDRTVRLTEEFGVTDPLLEQTVLALDSVVRDRQPGSRTYADQLALTIAAQLAWRHSDRHRAPAATARPAGLTDRQFTVVRELMDARLSDPLPLEELAAAVGLSVSQFARAFKARTGQPPHRYLMRLRVEQAARLLRTSTLPIAQIAAGCGFSHQEHLTRVLRAQLGSTPAELRQRG
ncbi:AraC family transcriptional regulator [Streptomyces spinoverrucosus]|uniref:AraC family transcriptional regulator n=1 Tax=Streptomyces spinoverrucosus TaxID=284043 RepID=A0A4Y3VAY9_9ACTN|nr:AraC family transcriptional regulator [Streptomyces spinoverrucosus]GEC03258.1 AraC family transcriptional regulator [Streptomyces spinoverrucosus]GHB37058.1 AraC family transcriptional regulator [Streptomyces spinoverrucosus]